MEKPAEIYFKNFSPPGGLYSVIEGKIEGLHKLYPRITACRVVVELPHRHHEQGNLFRTIVNIGVPGDELVINTESPNHRFEDAMVAVNTAFEKAKKILRNFSKRRNSPTGDS